MNRATSRMTPLKMAKVEERVERGMMWSCRGRKKFDPTRQRNATAPQLYPKTRLIPRKREEEKD